MERHVEGKKRSKGNKSIVEIRRGMLHSQLIGEQMRGAQKLEADTTQKMKTIKLTEEEKQEREKARYEIWETNIRKQRKAKETMKEMGWGKQKLRGRVEKKGERREQIIEKQQEKMYPKKDSVRTLTGNRKEIKKEKIEKPKINILNQKIKEEEEEIKGKIKKAVEAWQTYYEEGEEGTEEEERKEKEVMNAIKNAEVVGHATIETYIRKGLEAQKEKKDEETYTIGDYTILDVNWGQYTEERPGEIFKGREKAGKPLKEMMEESKKYIMVIHYSFHWSFVIIDNIKKRLSTYDSGVKISKYSHEEPHNALKRSVEDITSEQWNMEQIPVPQQDEGESCGYRMLSNLSRVTKGQEIRRGREKEHNRLYYYLEIAQTLKDNQIKRNQKRKQKRKRKEEEEKEGEVEQEEIEEEQRKLRQKRSKRDNTENKKRKRMSQGNKDQGEEEEEERQKRQKKQSKKEKDTEMQEQEERERHTYSLRSGRFRVENTQPD